MKEVKMKKTSESSKESPESKLQWDPSFKTRYYKYTLMAFAIIFAASFIVLFFSELNVRKVMFSESKSSETKLMDLETQFVDRELIMIIGDVNYLKESFLDSLAQGESYDIVEERWEHFSYEKKLYDQIRFINAEGYEEIRVNYDDTSAYAVPNNDLQFKGDRYYFQNTIDLDPEDIYVSALDLNMEDGNLEMPYNPVVRLAVPIVYQEQVQGIIIVNYFASDFLERFRSLAENSGGEVFLLNDQGYSISSDRENYDWEFLVTPGSESAFVSDYPDIWTDILNGSHQILTEDGLFTIDSINFDNVTNNFNFKGDIVTSEILYVVSFISRQSAGNQIFYDDTSKLMGDVLNKYVVYYMFTFLISIVIGLMVSINRNAYHKIKFYSEYDTLTKAYNRRAGMERLKEIFSHHDEACQIVSLCFIDINGLKQVNDHLGHKYGDELITSISNVIRDKTRDQDFLIRLGGDEFLIAFYNLDESEAEKVWQRIVEGFEEINTKEHRQYTISVSHGMVSYEMNQVGHLDFLISEADQKMYSEKEVIKRSLKAIKDRD